MTHFDNTAAEIMIQNTRDEPSQDDIDAQPWKYIGYGSFTSFVASDPDFFAIRTFDRLHVRALFTIQYQLSTLEEKLDQLDNRYRSKHVKIEGFSVPPKVVDVDHMKDLASEFRDINNGSIADDMPERAELISRIQDKLVEYDRLVLKYFAVKSLTRASEPKVRNIRTWLENRPGAIADTETGFIDHEDELISLPRPKTRFRKWLEPWIFKLPWLIKKETRTDCVTHQKSDVSVLQSEALAFYGSISVFLSASVVLILPLWVLYMVPALRWRLLIISISVFVFLGFLTAATLSRPFERLAATAGYAAVLVVFMQLGPAGG